MNAKNIEEIIREEKKKYFKNWRAKNPQRVKTHNENYWRKKVLQKIQNESNKAGEESAE